VRYYECVLQKQVGKYKLYYHGDWDEQLFTKCIAVVGSRRMTSYGRRVVEKIVPQLIFDGWTIVSGLMYGVDQTAHEVCLECGGKTIAVLGWGINYRAGDKEQELEDKIVQSGGLLLSLWVDQAGTNWTFPARNKVVAEISQELIVVEAAVKSGALLTAGMIRSLGKKVWAVPGPITSSVSAGTNQLIATGLALPWLGTSYQAPLIQPHNKILNLIQNEDLDAGEIARKLARPMNEINSELSLLLLAGTVTEKDGKYYSALRDSRVTPSDQAKQDI